jgi:hypothetical protein
MPSIAVGFLNVREVMAALQEEAERVGEFSRACLITPCRIGVPEADLARLAGRPRHDVHYDGHALWVHGVDCHVER